MENVCKHASSSKSSTEELISFSRKFNLRLMIDTLVAMLFGTDQTSTHLLYSKNLVECNPMTKRILMGFLDPPQKDCTTISAVPPFQQSVIDARHLTLLSLMYTVEDYIKNVHDKHHVVNQLIRNHPVESEHIKAILEGTILLQIPSA